MKQEVTHAKKENYNANRIAKQILITKTKCKIYLFIICSRWSLYCGQN